MQSEEEGGEGKKQSHLYIDATEPWIGKSLMDSHTFK